jgi:hypothetical protein
MFGRGLLPKSILNIRQKADGTGTPKRRQKG